MYDFKDKYALVTGGGQGLGFAYIRQLLASGIEGVSLIDINTETGNESTKILNEEFGAHKVIFIHVDVTKQDQFQAAFKKSVKHWKWLDIVINNAGVVQEQKWQLDISVNCGGTVQGTLLGFEYMSKNNGGRGGIIINAGSIGGIEPHFGIPVYSASKSFIIALGRALGTSPYYDYNGVQVITICPGVTDTSIMDDVVNNGPVALCPNIKDILLGDMDNYQSQPSKYVAKSLITVINDGCNGSVWVIEGNQPPYEVEYPGRLSMRKSSNNIF